MLSQIDPIVGIEAMQLQDQREEVARPMIGGEVEHRL